jgi:hypothetical protein
MNTPDKRVVRDNLAKAYKQSGDPVNARRQRKIAKELAQDGGAEAP